MEDVHDEGGGRRPQWYHGAAYTFHLPDGREVSASTRTRSGRLRPEFADLEHPISVEVEYDPVDPSISRLKGEGSQSFVEWLILKVGAGGFLLVLLMSPGEQAHPRRREGVPGRVMNLGPQRRRGPNLFEGHRVGISSRSIRVMARVRLRWERTTSAHVVMALIANG